MTFISRIDTAVCPAYSCWRRLALKRERWFSDPAPASPSDLQITPSLPKEEKEPARYAVENFNRARWENRKKIILPNVSRVFRKTVGRKATDTSLGPSLAC